MNRNENLFFEIIKFRFILFKINLFIFSCYFFVYIIYYVNRAYHSTLLICYAISKTNRYVNNSLIHDIVSSYKILPHSRLKTTVIFLGEPIECYNMLITFDSCSEYGQGFKVMSF